MAKFVLLPYDTNKHPKIEITSELNLSEDAVYISYKITGSLDELDLGDGTPVHERKIKLWEKTCFELFIKNSKDQYIEFNFSPVFEWNCFFFNKKGDPLSPWIKIDHIASDILLSKDIFHIIVEIKKDQFPPHFFDVKQDMSAGITSVIKNKLGHLSYWALSHEADRPNFHHFDSFKYKFLSK